MLGLREISAKSNPIFQDFFDRGSNQPGHLSWMGGENERAIRGRKGFRLCRQSSQSIGIQDDREIQCPDQFDDE